MDLRKEIESAFGGALFERPLFYSYPGGLRFALSAGETSIAQFLVALEKAQVIAGDVFPAAETFTLCLRAHGRGRGWECRDLLRDIRRLGIAMPSERALWVELLDVAEWHDDNEPMSAVTLAFQLPGELLRNVLWGALAQDLAIMPRLPCAAYLLNLRTGVALFPYDDRGMDVVGPNAAVLKGLYARRHAWLLPYDLPLMEETFGAPAAVLDLPQRQQAGSDLVNGE